MITLKINGVEETIGVLNRARGMGWATRPMQQSVNLLHNNLTVYPVALPTSRYVRTGDLGRYWLTKVETGADTVTGRIGNDIAYAPFVQSARLQSRWHRGRWLTDVQSVENNRTAILAFFRRAIDRALRGG